MDPAQMRSQLERGEFPPAAFASALAAVAPRDRDGWIDQVLGLGELAADGPELPPGCTPYLPVGVGALLDLIRCARVTAADTFVDIGSGAGRALVSVQLLTGAQAIGIEVQPALIRAAEALAARLPNVRLRHLAGDAAEVIGSLSEGTVFFLYAPFDAGRLDRVLEVLEQIARTRSIRLGCVNVPPISRPWLRLTHAPGDDLTLYESGPPEG